MYLKALYIQGFKSFANKTKIDFNNKITGIVGPNGSGKSNISDAIMWVLGETSVKSLRGSKMEDVIFSGTDKRKPLGFAEITIVLDNSDRNLPIEFNEVSVTRRMYRSLESEFYINNTKCRLKDIKELFMDTGIGKDGYSLIGQGRIESILSTKPDQRRAIFEEAAGISKFKMKKTESERKLEKTKENLIRLNDIISEIEKRKDFLYIQAQEAVKYKKLFNELKNLEISIASKDLEKKKLNIESLEFKIQELEETLENSRNEIKKLKENQNKTENEIYELEDKIVQSQESEINQNRELEQINSQIQLYSEKINFSNSNIVNRKKQIEELESENSVLKEKNADLKNKIIFFENSYNDTSDRKADMESILKNKEKELSVLENSETVNNQSYLEINKKINDLNSKIQLTESILKEKKERTDSISRNLAMLEENNNELLRTIEDTSLKYEDAKKDKNGILEEKTINDNYLKELEKLINKLSDSLYTVKNKFEEKSAKYNALKNISENYDGYSKSVKNFMNATQKRGLFKKSLIGTVADNIQVSEKYEKAVSVALGGSVQNLIIENEKDAKEMISFLTSEKLGRVTFLPLDSISYSNPKVNLNTFNNRKILGFADELIEYDVKFKNIFKNLLGRIIVTEDFDTGVRLSKELNRSYRIVTLDGDSLNIGGSITGGSIYKNNINILGRNNELKELYGEVVSLSEEYNEILKDYNNKKLKIEELKFTSSNLFNRLDESGKKLLSLENQLESLKSSKNNNQLYIDKYKNELNEIKNSIEADYETISKHTEEKEILEKEENNLKIASDNSKNNLYNIKSEIEVIRKDYSEISIECARTESKIKSLKNDISNVEQEIEKNIIKINESNADIENINSEISLQTNVLNNLKNDIIKCEEMEKSISSSLNELRNKRKEKSLYSSELRENIDKCFEDVSSAEKELEKKRYSIDKARMEIENIISSLVNEYKIDKKDIKESVEIHSVRDARSEISELKNSIENLGEINLLAIEEFEQIKERLEFNISQKQDLLDSIDEIKNILSELDNEMNDRFKESFKKISYSFNEIFKILFNGGRAEIEIDGEDPLTAGIEIKAQPPGKRFQSLSLLSGGERALTAVALLFALLKVKPAPFCILDEIDAALDDANIKRYTDYLLTLKDIQFIMITHRKPTMEIANKLYGVTMEEKGISKLISVELTN